MIISGSNKPKIGEIIIPDIICDTCGSKTNYKISVFGRYFHLFWIPAFPLGKAVKSECENCNVILKKKQFPTSLKTAYLKVKNKVKRPIWHWSGTFIITCLLLSILYYSQGIIPDSRKPLLQADISLLTLSPSQQTDSISFYLKEKLELYAPLDLEPHKFTYYSKIDSNKVLILIKIPKFKNVKKEERADFIAKIDTILNLIPTFIEKEKYIGIKGKYGFLAIKTPNIQLNGRFILNKPLYEFYGKNKNLTN